MMSLTFEHLHGRPDLDVVEHLQGRRRVEVAAALADEAQVLLSALKQSRGVPVLRLALAHGPVEVRAVELVVLDGRAEEDVVVREHLRPEPVGELEEAEAVVARDEAVALGLRGSQ